MELWESDERCLGQGDQEGTQYVTIKGMRASQSFHTVTICMVTAVPYKRAGQHDYMYSVISGLYLTFLGLHSQGKECIIYKTSALLLV